MDEQEARSILSLCRAGDAGIDDARLEEAMRKAEADPELARWWNEEQELDRIIASKLAFTHVPAGLKERVSSKVEIRPSTIRPIWSRGILLAAASIVALAVLFSSWRGPFQPAASMADYRDEMVSFIKVAPNLELESSELTRLKDFLANAEAPASFTVPRRLQQYEPLGCRVLRFRGEDVSLVCFKLGGDKLAHLFVTTAKTVRTGGRASAPVYEAEEGWMTATWTEGDQAYLLTVKGDRAALEKFLSTS
ncbi:MAG TPA: hypothetical protein VGP40_03265 [Chthoniobacterales bacterium]|nr:hypothetical protein [Chthoniobacterales bacterium]